MKSIICFIYSVFLLHRWQHNSYKQKQAQWYMTCSQCIHLKTTFVSHHSLEKWDCKIVICPYKCVSIHSWVCLCEEMTDIGLGVKQRERERETHQEKGESENPCSCCLAIITEPNLCQQWVPDGAHHRCAMSLKRGGERKIKSGMWNREALPNVDDVSYKY